jgi:hypothetical protein
MSGGSMNYLYSRVQSASFDTNTPERRAFRKHLMLVADALRAIEWVDSGDSGPGDENPAIRAVLARGDVLGAAIENAHSALRDLQAEIARAENAR